MERGERETPAKREGERVLEHSGLSLCICLNLIQHRPKLETEPVVLWSSCFPPSILFFYLKNPPLKQTQHIAYYKGKLFLALWPMKTCKYTKLKWSSTFIKLCRIVIFMLEVSWEYIYMILILCSSLSLSLLVKEDLDSQL